MISYIVNAIRQAFCKHDIVSTRSNLPTRRFHRSYDYEYQWNEYITILYCKHCTYSKKIKQN